jgi:hypothetical protein
VSFLVVSWCVGEIVGVPTSVITLGSHTGSHPLRSCPERLAMLLRHARLCRRDRETSSRRAPSHSWRSFLHNHTKDLVSIDFFVVPTATFRVLYVFLVLEHERRRIVHFDLTEGPSAQWTGQQWVNAFRYDSAPTYVIRDRDKIYGADFVLHVRAMGIEQVLTAPQSPWGSARVTPSRLRVRRAALPRPGRARQR